MSWTPWVMGYGIQGRVEIPFQSRCFCDPAVYALGRTAHTLSLGAL